jgi:hypothetical protein
MKQFKALDHFERGFVLPSPEAGSLMLSDNGKVLATSRTRYASQAIVYVVSPWERERKQ